MKAIKVATLLVVVFFISTNNCQILVIEISVLAVIKRKLKKFGFMPNFYLFVKDCEIDQQENIEKTKMEKQRKYSFW